MYQIHTKTVKKLRKKLKTIRFLRLFFRLFDSYNNNGIIVCTLMQKREKIMRKADTRKRNLISRLGAIALIVVLTCGIFGTAAYALPARDASEKDKHLVIKVVEDEGEMIEFDDYDTPLSSFSAMPYTADSSGTRHLVIMSVMLACVLLYVFYQGVNEKKLNELRKQAARAQKHMMTAERKL